MTLERIKDDIYSILRRLNLLENRGGIASVEAGFTISSVGGIDTYFVSCPSGNVLIILPNANKSQGRYFTFKKTDNVNTVFIQPVESQPIDNSLTYSLTTQYQSVTIVSDGNQYYITSTV